MTDITINEVRGSTELEDDGMRIEWLYPDRIVAAFWRGGNRIHSVELFHLEKGDSDVKRETLMNYARCLANLYNAGAEVQDLWQILSKLRTMVLHPDVSPVVSHENVVNLGYIVSQPEIVQYVAVSNTGQVIVVQPGTFVREMPLTDFEDYADEVRGYSIRQ